MEFLASTTPNSGAGGPMLKFPGRLIAGVLLVTSTVVHAEDPLPNVEFKKQFQLSAPMQVTPAESESAQALDGMLYTVISGLFEHDLGNISYIRFFNANLTVAVQVHVTVVGTPTGHVYGATSLDIPTNASKQYAYTEILQRVGVAQGQYIAGDTGFSFYLRSSRDQIIYQHVVHNRTNAHLENMSVCLWDNTFSYQGLVSILGNVHTTSAYMVAYPSYVMFHHYGSAPARYAARLFRSTDGASMGGFTFTMAPNASYLTPASWYENSSNWNPRPEESHMNLKFERDDGGNFEGLATHLVFNEGVESFSNMTQFCGISHQEP